MSANTLPRYALAPNDAWTSLTAANTATDGTGTVGTIFTAGANGGEIESVLIKPLGTNVQTVLRIFINNGSSNAVAANNSLVREITIAAATASNTTALPDYEVDLNIKLLAGYKINVAIGTAVAAGLAITGIGTNF